MAEKTRYSDAELEEFRAIIMEKLELAQRDYDQLKLTIHHPHTKYWKKELIHCQKKKRLAWHNVS